MTDNLKRARNKMKELGLKGFNKPKMTPSHPKKKGVVMAKEGNTTKLIRFGQKGYGHNYSPTARKSFKARHSQNIKKGKLSPAYWADKELWTAGGRSKKPPRK
jgi:hypothetical protein